MDKGNLNVSHLAWCGLVALPARMTGELPTLDTLLNRSGWHRMKAESGDPILYHLLAESFSGE